MIKTQSGNFSNMKQAERMVQKYRSMALDAELDGNFEKMERFETMADELQQAITGRQYRDSTRAEKKVFSKGVANRNQLDVEREILRELV